MKKRRLISIALWGFLIGIALIVFLQVISGRNINRLIEGNKDLLSELQIQNDLRKIEADILIIESDIRGAIISQDLNFLNDIQKRSEGIDRNYQKLVLLFKNDESLDKIHLLDKLLKEKIAFSHQILNGLQTGGKKEAEAIINTHRGQEMRDSILNVIHSLYQSRQNELQTIAETMEKSGNQARTWGGVLAIIACIAAMVAFWYIVQQSQRQQRMIFHLNKSEKRVKEAARLKEQFMANMSHEIRTPMNSIIGFTNLLRRTKLDDDQRQFVQNIHSAGENLLALVNDILDLSKIEAGMMGLEEMRFSIRSLISSVGAMFIEKAKEKKLNFQTNIDNEVPDILAGDAVRLTQILVNLIGNAVKFTEKGSITIKVGLLAITEKSVHLRITIIDTGIGIADEKKQYIFERFQQAEEETTRRFGGTGLGLSIVKQLVELQKGRVGLNSAPGVGSEFFIDIEYRIPDASEIDGQVFLADHEPVILSQMKVLIAEDNVMNQQLIKHLMKTWNLNCTLVNNGAEAIEMLRKEEFSIVLMDIQMPEMDGYVATGIIRNDLKLNIPIIAMTAHAMAGEKEKCLHLGMNDYISKPIKETALFNLIAQYAQANANNKVAGNENGKVVDLNYLHELSGNDKEFEEIMMQQFVLQTPEEMLQLQKAIEADDYMEAKKIAHSLKSTVGYMGLADRLHPKLQTIEKAATANNKEDIVIAFEEVKAVATSAVEEIAALLKNEV